MNDVRQGGDGLLRSLPSRERGLKWRYGVRVQGVYGSLPSRERGLKSKDDAPLRGAIGSLPSRERGLKCLLWRAGIRNTHVAPFTGAWIEIIFSPSPLTYS